MKYETAIGYASFMVWKCVAKGIYSVEISELPGKLFCGHFKPNIKAALV